MIKPIISHKKWVFCAKIALFFAFFFDFSFWASAQSAAGASGSWYLGKPIRNIVFVGLHHVKQADLDGVIEPYLGRALSDEIFWELQGRLYGLEYFEQISPAAVPADDSGSEVILRFTITERPVISRINFQGNSGLRAGDLRDAITIKANDVFNETKVRIDEQAVLAKYTEKGYPDASVRSEIIKNSNSTIDVLFVISEGEQITIDKINFEGNQQFSTRTMRGQISLSEKGILGGLFTDGAFQESKLVADRYAIRQYYHDRGYIDADITDVTRDITHDDKGAHLTLTFKIYEGRVYTFDGVTFDGNKIFSNDELQKLIHSGKGKTVNAQRLEADLQRVADLYYENGYIYNAINREEQRNMEAGTIAYVVHIVERDRAFIEHITVRGNQKTKDHVIMRELPLEVGDIFSKSKVYEGLRNLYNLQYFSSVVPETPPGSAEGLLDLIIILEEQPTTDIQAGLTFSGSSDPDAFPMSILVKWTDRNFLGYGNTFGVEVNASPDVQNVSVEYTQKWLFGLPLSGGFDFTVQHANRLAATDNQAPFFIGNEDYAFPDGFVSFSDYESANKTPPDEYLFKYTQWSVSVGFSSGYRWGTPFGNFSIGGGLRIGFKSNDYDRENIRAFDKTLRERDTWTPATSVYFTTALDDRDIFYDPTRGYYLVQRFGFYGLLPNNLEEEYFIRSDTKAEIFWTIWDWPIFENWSFKGVFGVHSGLSFLFPHAGQDKPTVEQANMLALDGMFIARGWTNQRLVRGTALWENWAELRLPLVQGVLALDGFFDMAEIADTPGNIFGQDPRGSFSDRLRFSMGAGLRFAIPQFPFRFLFAKRFRLVNGAVVWEPGAIGNDGGTGGIDFVLSFAVSTY
ncbi:MAG: outer membrane protein assembly factor BamA [Spirochaetaceae bacterium]|jgi:outer membrane protein insertion porin family|nr:outer membrane protein assembly factor BamA [Spirochaetaceae bacterium]